MPIVRFYLLDAFDEAKTTTLLNSLRRINPDIIELKTEKCIHVENEKYEQFPDKEEKILRWILKNPQDSFDQITHQSAFAQVADDKSITIEIGPRFNFSTADSTNSVSICHNIGLTFINRIEVSVKYLIKFSYDKITDAEESQLIGVLSDRMTQCRYTSENLPQRSFYERLPKVENSQWYYVPLLEQGQRALEEVNVRLGLAFDNWDLDYYTNLFTNNLRRNPTNVELFDLAQSNSEHSRHWFFKGRMVIDGIEQGRTLLQMIMDTQRFSNQNNRIKFSDNSSAVKGYLHRTLRPMFFTGPGLIEVKNVATDLIFTAETHNMPTAVAPFSGATTGTGGRLRDIQAVGRGGLPIAGTAGYCVGNLNIPNYRLSYEEQRPYPPSFETPLKIIIEASNGASDYGNKFGEPVISGFAISYGCINASGKRDEYVKPVMFSGGMGTMDTNHNFKQYPARGMLLAKIGGPVYRIGVGGGAASSVEVQGDNNSELDFNAVQRGDAEMGNKLNRVVRACVELAFRNPIVAIHDQGAGGNGNVLKELVEPGNSGAIIFSKEFQLGDPTITALELWGAEYQESNAILCKPEDRKLLEEICLREKCPLNFVGVVSKNGHVTLVEDNADFEKYLNRSVSQSWGNVPFNMKLRDVLCEMPMKTFHLQNIEQVLKPLDLSEVKINEALSRVLSTLTVGSKRFLTNKVDRCVTGLVAQQQCVGPLHTPLADCAVVAVSHFGLEGIVSSIGTQPIKGLIDPGAAARMSVAEAISNIVFAGVSELPDIKCSGNWMWAAKLPGEGAKMYKACQEMCKLMNDLNIAIDGGKDSLSMAARVQEETIKSPGTLVISAYAPCPDIRVKITPDLKSPSFGRGGDLILIKIEDKFRLGGSVLAQCYQQQGNESPNIERSTLLKRAFIVTQQLLVNRKLLSGHDISDGGLVTCILEMAFAGFCGVNIDLTELLDFSYDNLEEAALKILFTEECGWVLEVKSIDLESVLHEFRIKKVPVFHLGKSTVEKSAVFRIKGQTIINESILHLFKKWERTSFELEKLQMNPECAMEEFATLDYRKGPTYHCTFDLTIYVNPILSVVRVAVIREEGTNSDREMAAALIKANFEVHDVTMSDLLMRKATLDPYRGVIFPGGFSYADTLGSAKGWAASIIYSNLLAPQFENFKNRKDTFSLGVCNGCQLMSLIGWVGGDFEDGQNRSAEEKLNIPNVALLHNKSQRFECRWSTVKIAPTKAILLNRLSGSVLGCWTAHGEGRFSFKNDSIFQNIKSEYCVALNYVDDYSNVTETYPMNPNGSRDGIAGICSKDGRHLAMMPHPERCHEMWQWPYVSPTFLDTDKCPWQCMFDEAYIWCNRPLNN
uniref:Phosphoribosylformylglycinamidine synthase n=1 Tax=Corethrella appendiculata TaxID=1370023 RepID=W4VRR3_9DIPT